MRPQPRLGRRRNEAFSQSCLSNCFYVIPKQAAAPGRAKVLRFAGWALVLGGVGYALIWLLAPIAMAKVLAMLCLGGAVLAVLLRVLLARRGHDGEPSESC